MSEFKFSLGNIVTFTYTGLYQSKTRTGKIAMRYSSARGNFYEVDVGPNLVRCTVDEKDLS